MQWEDCNVKTARGPFSDLSKILLFRLLILAMNLYLMNSFHRCQPQIFSVLDCDIVQCEDETHEKSLRDYFACWLKHANYSDEDALVGGTAEFVHGYLK